VRELLSQMVDIVVHCERCGNAFTVDGLWWKEAEDAA
jgi:hypothetical protein